MTGGNAYFTPFLLDLVKFTLQIFVFAASIHFFLVTWIAVFVTLHVYLRRTHQRLCNSLRNCVRSDQPLKRCHVMRRMLHWFWNVHEERVTWRHHAENSYICRSAFMLVRTSNRIAALAHPSDSKSGRLLLCLPQLVAAYHLIFFQLRWWFLGVIWLSRLYNAIPLTDTTWVKNFVVW